METKCVVFSSQGILKNLYKNIKLKKESQYIQLKSSFNDEVIITLVAFANPEEGNVYVCMQDNGLPIPNFKIGKESVKQ